MTTARLALGLATAALLLAGCGNGDKSGDSPVRLVARAIGGLVAGDDAAPAPSPDQVAAAALTRLREPVILAILPGPGTAAAMVPYGRNGSVETWTTVGFQTVSLRGGQVVATRGLGNDLMAVSQSGARRTYHLMDAANDEVAITVDCTPRVAGQDSVNLAGGEALVATRIDETCTGADLRFVNSYWTGTDGSLRRSRQWLGPKTGTIELQRLR